MELATTFIETLEKNGDYSSSTVQAYSSDVLRFVAYLEKKVGKSPTATEFNAKRIKQFLENERKSGYKASTLHRRKIALSHFAHFLSDRGNLTDIQINDINSWRSSLWKEIYEREVHYLDGAEIEELYSAIMNDGSAKASRDISIISLIIETGLSVNKIISINLSDLDLRNKVLSYRDDRVGANYSLNRAAKFIQVYLKEGRPELTQSMNEAALFVSQLGGRISRQGVWQIVREWGKTTGIPVSLSPRVLRNTSVMLMVAEGLTIAEIQKRLGHRNRYSTRALVRKIRRATQD